MAGDPKALAEALAYFRPSEHSRDAATIVLTVGRMRGHLAVIEAALRASDGAGAVREEDGRTAYEARFAGEARITPWADLPEQARAVWRRVEARSAARMQELCAQIADQVALRNSNMDRGDPIAKAMRTGRRYASENIAAAIRGFPLSDGDSHGA